MKTHQQIHIPLVDLAAQQRQIHDEIWPILEQLCENATFIGGQPVTNFESAYAQFIGVKHCIGVANGTDAIELALRACGIGRGDEVIVPANTFIATAEAVLRAGAVPVLADIDGDTLLMDPQSVAERISPRTSAIVPVHLYGQMAPMDAIASIADSAGAVVIEDAAQAQGARQFGRSAGSIGLLSGTSFYPGKNLGAAGDAGAVTTNDHDLARKVRMLAAHGSEHKYVHEDFGFNSRLDTLQAAILSAKLTRLDAWNSMRREAAFYYQQHLEGVPDITGPVIAAGNEAVWHLFVLRVPQRDFILKYLNARGVGAAIHYPEPLHKTLAWVRNGLPQSRNPVAEATAGQLLSIPLYPHITRDQQNHVIEILMDALGQTQ